MSRPPTTVDQKLSFQQSSAIPSYEGWMILKRDLIRFGTKTCKQGYSLADCMLGVDPGGDAWAGAPTQFQDNAQVPVVHNLYGMPAGGSGLPGAQAGTAIEKEQWAARRSRLKETAGFVSLHIANALVTNVFTEPPYAGDGRRCYVYLETLMNVAPDHEEIEVQLQAWRDRSINKDVGATENSIIDLSSILDADNAMIVDPANRFNDTQKAEKMLRSIAASSKLFASEARTELDAAPPQRRFPAPGGAPNARSSAAVVTHFHKLWRAAVRDGHIPKSAPTRLARSGASAHGIERGRLLQSVDQVDRALAAARMGSLMLDSVDGEAQPAQLDPSESLHAVVDAGFPLQRGLVTTSDFASIPQSTLRAAIELACAVCDDDGDMPPLIDEDGNTVTGGFLDRSRADMLKANLMHGFTIGAGMDAIDAVAVELICDNCRGIGHIRRLCPSPKKHRTYEYAAEMLQQAARRAMARSKARGDLDGGRRSAPRGQKPPFKPGMPKRFQASHPSRRYISGKPPPRAALSAQSAEEGDEEEGDESGGTIKESLNMGSISGSSKEVQKSMEGREIKFSLEEQDYFEESLRTIAEGDESFEAEEDVAAVRTSLPAVSSDAVFSNTRSRLSQSDFEALLPPMETAGTPEATNPSPPSSGFRRSKWGAKFLSVLLPAAMAFGCAAMAAGRKAAAAVGSGVLVTQLLLLSVGGAESRLMTAPRTPMGLMPMRTMALPVSQPMHATIDADGWVTEYAYSLGKSVEQEGAKASSASAPNGVELEGGLIVRGIDRPPPPEGSVLFCVDSGATCVCVPASDEYLCDVIVERNPKSQLRVASDSAPLQAKWIGMINGSGMSSEEFAKALRLPSLADLAGKSFKLGDYSLAAKSFAVDGPRGVRAQRTSRPRMTRVLGVEGLRKGTRLAGVQPLKKDGILSYFNDDNWAGLEDCVRFEDGLYSMFECSRDCTIRLEVLKRGDVSAALSISSRTAPPSTSWSRRGSGHKWPLKSRAPSLPAGPSPGRTALSTHAGLLHCSSARARASYIVIPGFDLSDFDVKAVSCSGCCAAMCRPPSLRASAPSRGGPRLSGVAKGSSTRSPSSEGYTHFGQRVDSDICVSLPRSWPHGYTSYVNFCDRATADMLLFFMIGHRADEVTSALEAFEVKTKHRLLDGKVGMWHTDGEFSFVSAAKSECAERLISEASVRVPNDKDGNPVSERGHRSVQEACVRALAFAGADACLWPWIASQFEKVRYYLNTRALLPEMSPYQKENPAELPADMSWAEPMLCDVVVHLAERDVDGKLAHRSVDGCYLGHDFKRQCAHVYVPELRRIGHFTITAWKRDSFEMCKGITADTPVTYLDPDDLRVGPVTGSKLPERFMAREATETETLELNALHIANGISRLEKEGVERVLAASVEASRAEASPMCLYSDDISFGAEEVLLQLRTGDSEVEVELRGSERARAVVRAHTSALKYKTVKEAMESQHWPMIEPAFEKEMAGKLANGFAKLVPDKGQRCMKTKWVIIVYLAEDASVVKVTTRLVACGYSEIEGVDYGTITAPTLPGPCYRMFTSIVADEDLETDSIDAVKAFTQAFLDRKLYCRCPVGFEVKDHVLELVMNLEGSRQGAYLWFCKNKWAWNKCNMYADCLIESNLYTHETLPFIAAVFADDVGTGFDSQFRVDYLNMRKEYGKLIKIDSPGPDVTVPITDFTGTEWNRNRAAKTIQVTQRKYKAKLGLRYKGKFTLNDMPFPASKAKREAFENMPMGTEESMMDRGVYLEGLGSIGWPATMTAPEVAYTYSRLGSHSMYPLEQPHYEAVLHAIGYLVNTPDVGPVYGGKLKIPLGLEEFPPNFHETRGLYASTDSSWGKQPRPHGGHCTMRTNAVLGWSSRQLKFVCDSTCYAETAQGSRATKEVMFFKQALIAVKRPAMGPIPVLGDNSAMHQLVTKEGASQLTRHFERATVFIKWAAMKLLVKLHLVKSEFCIADIFTKAVDKETFLRLRNNMLNLGASESMLTMYGRAARMIENLSVLLGRLGPGF